MYVTRVVLISILGVLFNSAAQAAAECSGGWNEFGKELMVMCNGDRQNRSKCDFTWSITLEDGKDFVWKGSFKVDPLAQGFKGASAQKFGGVGIKMRGQLTVNCQKDARRKSAPLSSVS